MDGQQVGRLVCPFEKTTAAQGSGSLYTDRAALLGPKAKLVQGMIEESTSITIEIIK
jgi:hypothetical protein